MDRIGWPRDPGRSAVPSTVFMAKKTLKRTARALIMNKIYNQNNNVSADVTYSMTA